MRQTSRHHSSDFASSTTQKHQFKRSTGQEGVTFAAPGLDARSEITFIPEHPPNYWCGPVLPVYVYNCSTTTFSDLLLNLRTTQKIPDLYEDLTFEVLLSRLSMNNEVINYFCPCRQIKSGVSFRQPRKFRPLLMNNLICRLLRMISSAAIRSRPSSLSLPRR